MPESTAGAAIKEAKFAQALVAHNGNATEAYKVISPDVTHKSAGTLGARMLARVGCSQIEQTLKDIGATPDIVLAEALNRANKSKGVRDYLDTARLLAKVGGWGDQKSGININLNDNTLEVVDIVRVRLRKASKDSTKSEDTESKDTEVIDVKAVSVT